MEPGEKSPGLPLKSCTPEVYHCTVPIPAGAPPCGENFSHIPGTEGRLLPSPERSLHCIWLCIAPFSVPPGDGDSSSRSPTSVAMKVSPSMRSAGPENFATLVAYTCAHPGQRSALSVLPSGPALPRSCSRCGKVITQINGKVLT